tara:strand:+ start:195 stop:890 length:696 start_codon:yes stop_codon:yes gene_type:complete
MNEITQIRKLSLWIFIIPFITINLCLLISINFNLFENTFLIVDQIGRSQFTIPYIDGSLSISRASRTYPQFMVFKPGMIITAFLLYFYWCKNNSLINSFRGTKKIQNNFKIFGILSAFFLAIHCLLLGVETDVKLLKFLRRVILLNFIIFEIIAQGLLVYNFYKLKNKIKHLFNKKILISKIILVSLLALIALLSIPILLIEGDVHFKHALEWNYFLGIIFFYLLTRFFWR